MMDVIKQRIARLAAEGKFGEGTLLQVRSEWDEGKGAQYASAICFLCVELSTEDGVVKEVPVVCKTQLENTSAMDFMDTHLQFTIEVMAYDKVLPLLGVNELGILPKLYFGHATSGKDPSKDIMVLEDLRHKGFRVAKDNFLDYDALSLTMKKLGEFHGKSYKIKRSSVGSLLEIVHELPPRKIVDNGTLFLGGLLRGFRPFIECEPVNATAKKAYDKLSGKPMLELWDNASKAEEPFAVVAHGDFNKNNILYSYNDQGKINGVKFFDFATLSYLDPTTDISFILYMNMPEDMREKHWDNLLVTYWEGLTSVESDPGFGFQDFLNNFKRKAVYGFFPCSFFLPMMLFPEEADLTPERFLEMSPEEKFDWGLNSAGAKGDSVIISIVKHLLEKGYLDDLDYL